MMNQPPAQFAGRGSNLIAVREYNERLVLQAIRTLGSSSKAQVARATGLTAQTVGTIIGELEQSKLIHRAAPIKGKVGQPSIPFEINPDGALAIGVHIGRRSTEMLLTNLTGSVIARMSTRYSYPDPDELIEFVSKTKRQWARRQVMKSTPLIGIGICKPSAIGGWQEKLGAPTELVERWNNLDFEGLLDSSLGQASVFCNDASAACAAELLFGNSAQYPNHLYIYCGSFVGGGLVIEGNPHLGRTGNAAAVGSLPMHPNSKAQLIDRASLIGLETGLVQAGLSPTTLWETEKAWREHQTIVMQWIRSAAPALAFAGLSASALLELDAVVIDGAFPSWVRSELVAAIKESSKELNSEGVETPMYVNGNIGLDARGLGSAALPLLATFAPNHQSLMKA